MSTTEAQPESITLTQHLCHRCGHRWYGKPSPKRCANRASCGSKYWYYPAGFGLGRGRRKGSVEVRLPHHRVLAREEKLLARIESWEKAKLREKKRKAEKQVLRALLKRYRG